MIHPLPGTAALLLAIYLMVVGDSWTPRETILVTVGNLAMFGSLAFLVVGPLTPRDLSDVGVIGESQRPAR